MSTLKLFGGNSPGPGTVEAPGRLIVIEGTDRVGRSTQVKLLKEWLEDRGYGVVDTGLTRSKLAGPGIKQAKMGHTMDPITLNLFYATDFCDRVERVITPSLHAGMVVLADRYVYSMIARAAVRGVRVEWMEGVYSFAPVPNRVVYLDADVETLVPRVMMKGGFDFWESGQDFLRTGDPYESFIEYQSKLVTLFRDLARRYDFHIVDARGNISGTFHSVLQQVRPVVESMSAGVTA
ncbi:MAG: dTMP kinase [Chloroflexota bacterium]